MSGYGKGRGWLTVYPPLPHPFAEVRILKDFKWRVFGSADCKGVTGGFFGTADSTGFTAERMFGGGASEAARRAPNVRIYI